MAPHSRPVATGSLAINGPESYVYLVYTDAGELLYVGLADDIAWRLANHRRNLAPWHYLAARVDWESYPSREAAAAAERQHIRQLRPRFNVVHNSRPPASTPSLPATRRKRLGKHISDRRIELQRTQRSLARATAVSASSWRRLEDGVLDDFPAELISRIELALRWQPGSVRSVLAGGAAEDLPASVVASIAQDAYDDVMGVIA